MKNTYGQINRPGGFEITDKAVSFCSFLPGTRILDIGCGSGATVNYLTHHYGFDVSGIDINPGTIAKGNVIHATGENIPFDDHSMDGVMMECSFSLMKNQEKVLEECHRILKQGGYLVISDMYALGEPATLTGSLGRLENKDTIMGMISKGGFITEHFEDFTRMLQTMWGQMILDKGAEAFYEDLETDKETLKKIHCGYYLLIAKKLSDK